MGDTDDNYDLTEARKRLERFAAKPGSPDELKRANDKLHAALLKLVVPGVEITEVTTDEDGNSVKRLRVVVGDYKGLILFNGVAPSVKHEDLRYKAMRVDLQLNKDSGLFEGMKEDKSAAAALIAKIIEGPHPKQSAPAVLIEALIAEFTNPTPKA